MVEAGLYCIDTADVYSRWAPPKQGGESETLIGKWLKRTGKRDRIVLATKVGMEMGAASIRPISAAPWKTRYGGCKPIISTCTPRRPEYPAGRYAGSLCRPDQRREEYRSTRDAAKNVRSAKIVEQYLEARGERILNALDEVASAPHSTPTQVALAWQIAQPGITFPIASAITLLQHICNSAQGNASSSARPAPEGAAYRKVISRHRRRCAPRRRPRRGDGRCSYPPRGESSRRVRENRLPSDGVPARELPPCRPL